MLLDCFSELPEEYRGGVVAIGNFDGVHRGHSRLLAALRGLSRQLGRPAVVVSFEPHPVTLLRPDFAPSPLLWPDRKAQLLRAGGVDQVVLFQATHQLLSLSAEQFFEQIVRGRLAAAGMVEGPNFGFGRNRAGNVERLAAWCAAANIPLRVPDAAVDAGGVISSSRVRKSLDSGDVAAAAKLLGRPHRIRGQVAIGDRRGAAIGVPTANLAHVDVLIPASGVYAGAVPLDGHVYPAACNIGPAPTFGVVGSRLEVHLVGFSGDLYRRTIEVDLLDRLRSIHSFETVESLKTQLADDIARARQIAAAVPHNNQWRGELERSLTEWLRMEIEPSLVALGGKLCSVEWRADGLLLIRWSMPPTTMPSDSLWLLHRLEESVRHVYPEVTRVVCTAPSSHGEAEAPKEPS